MKLQNLGATACALIVPAGLALADTCSAICNDGEECIAGALYPYVPDTKPFAKAICGAWAQSGETAKLYLIADEDIWDGGYASDPVYTNGSGNQAPIDVFVFDAIYLEYWKTQTVPIPADAITDSVDVMPYAMDALQNAAGGMDALPLLGCTNIMFYRDGDTDMAGVDTLDDFLRVNPAGVFTSPVPADALSGAMMNMAGKTTIAVDYMIKGLLENGDWPKMDPLDTALIDGLADIAESSSYYNALTGAIPRLDGVAYPYVRAGYFSEGFGRVSVGFSESMSQMSQATHAELRLKAFPWSTISNNATPFYADVAGVNAASRFLEGGGGCPSCSPT